MLRLAVCVALASALKFGKLDGVDKYCEKGIRSVSPEKAKGAPYTVCCAAFCGQCTNQATEHGGDQCSAQFGKENAFGKQLVKNEDAGLACCPRKMHEAFEKGELKSCSESLPPCHMDESAALKEFPMDVGKDCNKALDDWRAASKKAIADGVAAGKKPAFIQTSETAFPEKCCFMLEGAEMRPTKCQ